MRRIIVLLAAVGVVSVASCQGAPYDPPSCYAIPAQESGLPDDTVWGFADLHAHPAIEKAFGGRLIWGTALDGANTDATELPVIDSCPVETHDSNAASPIDRTVGGIVFPAVAKVASFAHGPVGDLSWRPSYAWPDARDVIHQQMNVSSIRRAYEGGLRLMFASTTDDQVIKALLAGPDFINGFVPDAESDFNSAKTQLRLIQTIVENNKNWMDIARSPSEARSIIRSGKLAVVMSLEMNGLSQDDLDTLVDDYGVRHVIPVHLIDNDIGGTACNSDLFNASSATVSEIYRADHKPMGYMDVIASSYYGHGVGWPEEIGALSVPLYVNLQSISYSWYSSLCYEPLAACAGTVPTPTSFIQFGQQNLRGLCTTKDECLSGARPGKARIAHMMDRQLFVDVSHMSANSVQDTFAVTPTMAAPAPAGYPLLASHGDFVHLCPTNPPDPACVDGSPGTERSISGDAARTVVARQGVLGLGSGTGTYGTRTVLEARGGPLLTLNLPAGQTTACAAAPNGDGQVSAGCQPIPVVSVPNLSAPLDTLQVIARGGLTETNLNGHPFVRIALASGASTEAQSHVIEQPLECTTDSCTATISLGLRDGPSTPPNSRACDAVTCQQGHACGTQPYTFGDIQSVSIEWLYLGCDEACQSAAGGEFTDVQCQSTGGTGIWTIDEATLLGGMATQTPTKIVTIGPRVSAPITQLDGTRGGFTLYQGGDTPAAGAGVPATGHLLRVTVQSAAGTTLLGANTERVGSNVCVAVRHITNGVCTPAPALAAGATECDTSNGWARLNQRGAWNGGTNLYTFVRSPRDESTVCGVDVAVLDADASSPPWGIDEIHVEAAEDPLGRWIRRYAQAAKYLAGGAMGAISFGTDFNGLNGLTDISEFPLPDDAESPSYCPAPDQEATPPGGADPYNGAPLVPMRLLHGDGSLGDQVLIDERGLATYGLLADALAIIGDYPGCGRDVRDSLLLSAEQTIRAWELMVNPTMTPRPPLPKRLFDCGPVPGLKP